MVQIYEDKPRCSGCAACKSICPKNAIRMEADEKGFLYPVIDGALCVDCGRCVSVCPLHKEEMEFKQEEQCIFAVQHPDKAVVKQSSSGGAFTLLSDPILQQGGVVFGCVIDDGFNVIHTMAVDTAGRDRMRGSKYAQSDMRDVYRQVKQACRERPVLFVGTPCQVAGLNAYLGQLPENLLTVDFICHGTPSAKFFGDHIHFLEKKYGKKAVSYKFRDKKYGWRHVETVFFADGSQKTSYWTFRLKKFFSSNINLRPACYECRFTHPQRVADITIGDFWQAEKILNIYDNVGISLIIANTSKAKTLLQKLEGRCFLREVSMEDIQQRALIRPATKPIGVDAFWQTYIKEGYKGVMEKYREPKAKHYARFIPVSIITKLGLDKHFNILKTKIRRH